MSKTTNPLDKYRKPADILRVGVEELEKRQNEKISKIFTIKKASELANLRHAPKPKRLFGNFWFEGELCLLFAKPNRGKSILAVQIADAISRGAACAGLANEAGAQTVLYFDFELTNLQFINRYVDDDNRDLYYKFSDNLLRPEVNYPTATSAKECAEMIKKALQQLIQEQKAKVVIIDNITRIAGDLTEGKFAFELMTLLDEIKKTGTSILVLGHSRKNGDSDKYGLSAEDSMGSTMIMNFVDSAFCIGKNNSNPSTRYLKQIKARSAELLDDVVVFEQCKDAGFLQFKYAGVATESEQLAALDDDARVERDEHIISLYNGGITTYYQIAKQINESGLFKTKIYAQTAKRVIERVLAERAERAEQEDNNDKFPDEWT